MSTMSSIALHLDDHLLWMILPIVPLSYLTAILLYNVYLHPLASYPGPFLARSSLLWRFWHSMGGRFHRSIQTCHAKYGNLWTSDFSQALADSLVKGPVFRVSPNELSFASVESWKAIYGHPSQGQEHCIKSEFYDVFAAGYDSKCIGSERIPQKHAAMKRTLNPAFSTKALTEQEDIIQTCVNAFLEKLHIRGCNENGLNMTHWYEMLAFDILGEMAFGQSFNCIRDEKPHFWFEMLTKYLRFVTLFDNLRRYPLLLALGRLVAPLTASVQKKQQQYTRQLVERRLRSPRERKDFMTNVIDKVKKDNVSREELTAHASTLVIAGGETIASFLAATTFYLCTNRRCLERLQQEIRTTFRSLHDINATAASQTPYLQAVIQESLRVFPPGSQGFPRISPGMEIDGHWVPKSTEVYTSAWTVTHNPEYFHSPDEFIPERWMSNEYGDIKEASQPFSLGPRTCLGRNFALMEANLILCTMLFEFDIDLRDPDQAWESKCHMHVNWLKPDLYVKFVGTGRSQMA